MPKLLILNTSFLTGGAGKVTRGIAEAAAEGGWEVLAAHSSRYSAPLPDSVRGLRIGSKSGEYLHAAVSYLLDAHGTASKQATRRLITEIEAFGPDVINIHNLHGYYLNIRLFTDFLRRCGVPVVWTLHDLWPLTGRCATPDAAGCDRFLHDCGDCPSLVNYPRSLLNRSAGNLIDKKTAFSTLPGLHLTTMSEWLARQVSQSYLSQYPLHIIPNGVNLGIFQPADDIPAEPKSVLAVASGWTKDKGYDDIIRLRQLLPADYKITLVGVTPRQKRRLSALGIVGIEKTESPEALADLYRRTSVFVTLSKADNFPTVLLEALACGTPAVCYDTGACREIVAEGCGFVVAKGDVKAAAEKIIEACDRGKDAFTASSRRRAEMLYDRESSHASYLNLFNNLI